MTEEQIRKFMEGFLMPQMEDFAGRLEEAGIGCRLTLADDPVPGVMLQLPEGEVFATFLDAVDAEDGQRALLRLSRVADDEEGNPLPSRRWAVPYSFVEEGGSLQGLLSIFLSGATRGWMFP